MPKQWFVIVNPTSGNGASKKQWPRIYKELKSQQFQFEYVFTEHKNHAIELVKNAIDKGFTKIICVGGDGTLHSVVNGILRLNIPIISEVKIGVIPIGTGNDWVKTYGISTNYKKAIEILKTEHTTPQDIGKINLTNTNTNIYFNNLAGIGFDGYVVNKVHKYKNLGSLAYLAGALLSLFSYKKPLLEISFNNTVLKQKTLLLFIGIGKYCGGGMQLTQKPDPLNGLFDISFVKNISLVQLLINIPAFFNGKITQHKIVENYKTSELKIKVAANQEAYIQADGELIGSGSFSVSLLPKALTFIVPKK
ncbi:lipid kinase, YegS/Rv2252/BmrU family [Lutibacter agarilyticus]|uniref:Lipid kinase, YegS/Rv2252/BmrU family n=1 Tax=Lutibacter agarilyticus TaxID=1109740 RepID=A0A238W1W0_9FLAO|nr:diacylglycerol kinase family protein [Lutibacter agarilyticus]SNR40397.1 lipid kinase, YegS/Rv2252/BmrU family [Lutibacter agarilyticus]